MLRKAALGASLLLACARGAPPAAPTVSIPVQPAAGGAVTTTTAAADAAPAPRAGFADGEVVEVEWHGSWWPAVVLRADEGGWLVRYDGYGAEWDEIVGPERIRRRGEATEEPDIVEPEEDDGS